MFPSRHSVSLLYIGVPPDVTALRPWGSWLSYLHFVRKQLFMGQRRPIYQSLCVQEQTPKYCVSLHLPDRAVLTNYSARGSLFIGYSV